VRYVGSLLYSQEQRIAMATGHFTVKGKENYKLVNS
jgi:hypothetical protein